MTHEEEQNIKKITSNQEYITWLNTFTITNPGFMSEDWLFSSERINKEDYENVTKIYLLFEAIRRYATENYIYPYKYSFGEFYRIKSNDINYEIGTLEGPETLYYVNRITEERKGFEIKTIIDFEDIINNKKQPNADEINKKLNDIKERITYLYQSGMPIEKIERYLKNFVYDTEKKLILK